MSEPIDVRNHTELFLQAILNDSTEAPEVRNHLQLWLKALLEKSSGGGSASSVAYDNTLSGLPATNVQTAIDVLAKKPYLSLERVSRYLYNVSFATAPDVDVDFVPMGGCSAFVQDGKLYRNLDWNYGNNATFHVFLPGIEGLAFIDGLTDTELDDELIAQLPYRMVDGSNEHGIMVSTHVLYNDWDAVGTGDIPLMRLPYITLSRVKSMETIETDLAGVLDNLLSTPALIESGYLIQVLVTDGTTTYVLRPGDATDATYELVDITSNPKLSNFRWVSSPIVNRADLQTRPTGVERWNLMPCALEDLRFTKAYESPDRLSEFIGINGTDKDSTDEELLEIYNLAHAAYETRERDGTTWQTMHSAVYSPNGLEHLYIQENWTKDYISIGESFDADDIIYDPDSEHPEGSVGEELSKLSEGKVDTPPVSTPANYVPTSDGEGGYTWEEQQGGGGDADWDDIYSQIQSYDSQFDPPSAIWKSDQVSYGNGTVKTKLDNLSNATGIIYDDETVKSALDARAKKTEILKDMMEQSQTSWTGAGVFVFSGPVPMAASALGTMGQVTFDTDYLYICVAENTWKRIAFAEF